MVVRVWRELLGVYNSCPRLSDLRHQTDYFLPFHIIFPSVFQLYLYFICIKTIRSLAPNWLFFAISYHKFFCISIIFVSYMYFYQDNQVYGTKLIAIWFYVLNCIFELHIISSRVSDIWRQTDYLLLFHIIVYFCI